jgi:squalene-hopene/tetraprenyl-beta-curcumene cyclase
MLTTPDAVLRDSALDQAIATAQSALADRQDKDGHWVFELEADATIPAEYILLEHFLDRIDAPLQARLGNYLRRIQGEHGGWPLYYDGRIDLSASVKAYFALKAVGDDPEAPHMRRAREAILALGGAERSNVFTRFQLALFGEIPWRGVPVMPVELMLMPRWFFFNIWNMSYWSRTVVAPLLVLAARKPRARNPRGVSVRELFATPPEQVRDWTRGPYRSVWGRVFKHVDSVLRVVDPFSPGPLRRAAIRRAVCFVEDRLNGEDGLGAIYPAMANSVMMYDALGVPPDRPHPQIAWRSVRNLLVDHGDESYCQPCVSPIWDTGLAGHAMIEAASGLADLRRGERVDATMKRLGAAGAWLRERQVLDVKGDWAVQRPDLAPGGWAFQYRNDYYPDVDDTAVVGMLLDRLDDPANAQAIERARVWVVGMQSSNGGWGAFDVDNNRDILNHIPFADHGALLDPPTADVTARCISFLAQLGHAEDRPVIARAIAYLRREQEADGSWFGRWGTNYIYGTWSVLCALNAAGIGPGDPAMRRAVDWLLSVQREDGGWGEDCATFEGAAPGRYTQSLPSQTAWALLGLMAAGERDHPATARGIAYLTRTQEENGEWQELPYNAVGFPKVFYLRYHGYRMFFPLLALARYRNLGQGNSRHVSTGF